MDNPEALPETPQPPETAPSPLRPVPPSASSPRGFWMVFVATVAAFALLAGGAGIGWAIAKGFVLQRPAGGVITNPIRPVPAIPGTRGGALGGSLQSVADKVAPAVVDINVTIGTGNRSGSAAGTGMILTSGGEVLTNNHVVQGATSIQVAIQGRSGTYKAHVLGTSPGADVALIQVEGVSGLPTVKIADSGSLAVGDTVIAIGNALGRGGAPSVTQGTVTALGQSITASDGGSSEQLSGLIETNAPIVPGDSGGPLVNSSGQVVGMITAGSSARGFRRGGSSDGFAVPTNAALDVVNTVRSGSSSNGVIVGTPGYLGVEVTDLDPATAGRLGLKVTSGALVTGVISGMPAEAAGIAQDAVITQVNGKTISSSAALGPAIQSHRPGDKISVTWVDSSGSHTKSIALASGPAA